MMDTTVGIKVSGSGVVARYWVNDGPQGTLATGVERLIDIGEMDGTVHRLIVTREAPGPITIRTIKGSAVIHTGKGQSHFLARGASMRLGPKAVFAEVREG